MLVSEWALQCRVQFNNGSSIHLFLHSSIHTSDSDNCDPYNHTEKNTATDRQTDRETG